MGRQVKQRLQYSFAKTVAGMFLPEYTVNDVSRDCDLQCKLLHVCLCHLIEKIRIAGIADELNT